MDPTIITWLLVVFGASTLLPLALVQLVFLLDPHGDRSKEWLIGEGEEWRDKTHFRFSVGAAWADWLFAVPTFLVGSVAVLLGQSWGYVLFGVAGASSLYINVILWFMEKEYVYPSRGPARYFTYYWGFFIYWGTLSMAYSALRIGGVAF